MPFTYRSGEEIKEGDRILYHREPGHIEFVVTEATGIPEMDWYIEEFGGGVMVIERKFFGSVFLPADTIAEDEDLEFVSRAVNV